MELAQLLDGFDEREAQGGLAREELRLAHDGGHGAARDGGEEVAGEFLELVERGLAE